MNNSGVYIGVEDLATNLDMSVSTIKKYYLLIEDNGYSFKRNQQGHVMFSSDDYQIFKKIIEVKSRPKMTLAKSIEEVIGVITDTTDITPYNNQDITVITEDLKKIYNKMIEQSEIIERQSKLIEEQSKQLDRSINENQKRQKLLEDKTNENTTQELLTENLNQTKELKEMFEKAKEEKGNKWWKFW